MTILAVLMLRLHKRPRMVRGVDELRSCRIKPSKRSRYARCDATWTPHWSYWVGSSTRENEEEWRASSV